jgi:hypothetical protein
MKYLEDPGPKGAEGEQLEVYFFWICQFAENGFIFEVIREDILLFCGVGEVKIKLLVYSSQQEVLS